MSSCFNARSAVTVAVALLALPSISTRADIITGMPDAIVCSVKDPTGILPWDSLVFYVSAHMRDGDTLYKSSTSDPVVLLVSAEGIVSGANLADCDGRSVESLRKESRAFTLTVSRQGQAAKSRK
jgi:hypothetical protein